MVESMLSFDEVRGDLEDLNIRTSVFNIRDLRIRLDEDNNPVLDLNNGEQTQRLQLGNQGKSDVQKATGFKFSLIGEYGDDEDLINSIIKHSLDKRADDTWVGIISGESITGLCKVEDAPLADPLSVFDTVAQNPDIIGVENFYVEKDGVRVNFLTNIQGEPPKRVGDVSHVGLHVNVGKEVELSPRIYRLVCSNGMITGKTSCNSTIDAVTTTDEFLSIVGDRVRESIAVGREQALPDFFSTDDVSLGNAEVYLQRFMHENNLNDRLARRINDNLAELNLDEDNVTGYDMVNLITSTAHNVDSNRLAEQFQNLGWSAVHDVIHVSRCDRCGNHLNASM